MRRGSGRYPDCDGSRGLIRGNYHLARRGKWDGRILKGGGGPSPWPQRDHYRAMCATALSSFPGVAYLLPYYLAYGLAFYLVSSFPPSTSVDSQPNTRGLLIGRKTEDETRVKFETLEFLSLL